MTHRGLKLNPPTVEPSQLPRSAKVGRPVKHDSAHLHVQGAAAYIDDMPEPEGTLHVAPGYADITAGAIKSINLDAVHQSDGVVAVLTAQDIPGVNDCSPALGDDLILAQNEIEFHGQVIFAVVATTRHLARVAATKAVIDTVPAQPIVSAEEGKARDQHLLPPYAFRRGDPEACLQSSPARVGEAFKIGGQEHFYLEGQIALAVPGDDQEMTVYSSSQHPAEVQHTVAKMLDVPDAAITCACRRMGGGFGGKESQAAQWAALAALAAFKTGRPAKMRLDRDDDMRLTGKRHDFDCSYEAGFDKKGILEAVSVTLTARCGNSADLSTGVIDRAMFHADNAYYFPNAHIQSERIRTNTVSNTAFRGFGGPQGMVFAERMMEAIALKTGRDPLDIRVDNLYREGADVTPYGMQVCDNIMPELLSRLEASSDYRNRRSKIAAFNSKNQYLKKGLALTPVKFGISFTLKHLNQAGALVHVYGDGSVQLNHGGTEMGQGLYVKVAQVVADVFGIDLDRVMITATRTDKVPNASPTAASSGSDLNGMAAFKAASIIRDRMRKLAAHLYHCDEDAVEFADNSVICGETTVAFAELARMAILERVSLSSTGYYATPNITWDRDSATGQPFLYFAYGAACSEVTIDTLTGEMKLDQVDILHDVGHSLNPAIDIGQIEGGFVQGLGWLTTEELVFDSNGILRTHAPSTYKIPTASDLPEHFNVALMPPTGHQADTIHKSKAVGEPPVMLAISVYAAILNAVSSTLKTGDTELPPLNAPATPEAILTALQQVKQRA